MSNWEFVKFKLMQRINEGRDLLAEYIYREERPEIEPEIRLEGYLKEKEKRRMVEQEMV